MIDLRVPKGVRRIVLLQPDASGALTATTVFRAERKRRKGTVGIRQAERVVRRMGRSQLAAIDTYLARHERSNQKKRDGWLRDLSRNVYKAGSKGMKKLT